MSSEDISRAGKLYGAILEALWIAMSMVQTVDGAKLLGIVSEATGVWRLSMYGNELKWGVSAGPGGAEESEVCEYQLTVWSCCGCFHVV